MLKKRISPTELYIYLIKFQNDHSKFLQYINIKVKTSYLNNENAVCYIIPVLQMFVFNSVINIK